MPKTASSGRRPSPQVHASRSGNTGCPLSIKSSNTLPHSSKAIVCSLLTIGTDSSIRYFAVSDVKTATPGPAIAAERALAGVSSCPPLKRPFGSSLALRMLEQPVGPENNRLVEARSGLDASRPCGRTTVLIDEDPCNLLCSQQRLGIRSFFEDRLDLCPATPVFIRPQKVSDQYPMMPPRCDPGAQVRPREHHVGAGLVGDPPD